jgi:hypothetical protein
MNRKETFNHKFHPGFAWAFRRKWFRKVGFFEYGITGSGDTLSAAAWLDVKFPPTYLKPASRSLPFKEFLQNFRNLVSHCQLQELSLSLMAWNSCQSKICGSSRNLRWNTRCTNDHAT